MRGKHVSEKTIEYDGSQLSPLWAYVNLDVSGDSIVSFRGPCGVLEEHMVDMEDLREGAAISSRDMLHFIVEFFGATLKEIILIQRLLLAVVSELIDDKASSGVEIRRDYDNIYAVPPGAGERGKLSVSVATVSQVSGLVHLGLNVTGEGAPVRAVGLSEIGIEDIDGFATDVEEAFIEEIRNIEADACKVRPLT